MPSRYETDYYAWAMETARALRAGRIQDVDLAAAAEEIEDLGKSERRSLHSAVVQLFLHLLKSKYQPNLATASWQISIEKQRLRIADILDENPSLRPLLKDVKFMAKVYTEAVLDAAVETGLPKSTFPAKNPFTVADTKATKSKQP
jgi:hypothetical protein